MDFGSSGAEQRANWAGCQELTPFRRTAVTQHKKGGGATSAAAFNVRCRYLAVKS
jgi:hypothetical protein